MAVDHLASPVPIPDFSHLTVPELTSLRGFITSQMKEARKKSNASISKVPSLRPLWMETLASKPGATDEEKEQARLTFHREVLRHPEAFLAYANANALHVLDQAVWSEIVRRSK